MQIVIVKKSTLNNCWSSYQYTNNCDKCDKVLTCKVKTEFHKKGIINYTDKKIKSLNEEIKNRTNNILNESKKALEILNK